MKYSFLDSVDNRRVNYHHQRWWLGYAPLEGGRKRLSRAGFTARGGGFYRVMLLYVRS